MDYSYREMKRMQEDAIRRVWEMQERATLPIEPTVSAPTAKKKPETKPAPSAPPPITKPRRKPNDFTSKIPNKISNIFKDDELCEQILLIAIIMLLVNEKADSILVLAVLYILAD